MTDASMRKKFKILHIEDNLAEVNLVHQAFDLFLRVYLRNKSM